MSFKLYTEMSEQELENLDLTHVTGLKIGDKVRHKNAGQTAGSSGIIPPVLGTVKALKLQGLHYWGGLCVTAEIEWLNGETYDMLYQLVIKEQ